MRLIVARCEVRYSGRLSAVLPEALRLIMVKSDGSVMVHADHGGYKPQQLDDAADGDRGGAASAIVVRKRAGASEDRLDIRIAEVLSRRRRTTWARPPRSRRTASRRDLQEALAAAPELLRRGLPARAPRVADRHRPRRPHVPRRRRRLDRGRDQARRRRSTRSSSSRATSSASASTRRWPTAAASSPPRQVKPQARVLAEARGIACVEVDLAVLRGEREPELTLFGA